MLFDLSPSPFLNMKHILTLILTLAMASLASAQNIGVVSDTNGNIITGRTNALAFTNQIRVKTTNALVIGGVGGEFEVMSRSNLHGIVSQATNVSGGSAFYGFSASGAPAMKMVQSNNYDSPVFTAWRAGINNSTNSAAVLIASDSTNANAVLLRVERGTNTLFEVRNNGVVVSGGLTATKTFTASNGVNTVVISNGIITSWSP